jgi:hypothetical protein
MNIEPLNENTLKFNTCKYRSAELEKKLIQRCSCKGGNYTIEGYRCEARQIFQVTLEICNNCPVYESK